MVSDSLITLINDYREKILQASHEFTKKEIFKDLLNRLYNSNEDIKGVIDSISEGSERTILNIPRLNKYHSGRADTQYNQIIIEFENDLTKTLNHAKIQLAGYFLGLYNSGKGCNFTLIASDFISWKVFSIDLSQIDKLSELNEDELKLIENEKASFTLDDTNAEDFFYWIDSLLLKEQKKKATLDTITASFGQQSPVFIHCYKELQKQFKEAERFGEVQVSFEQWSKFLSIAYGSFDATEESFLIHTYLSAFSKMLAYTVVTDCEFIPEKDMQGIISGKIFREFNIINFVDNDFYYWIAQERSFKNLGNFLRSLAQEIASFSFESVEEDILKGVYQQLIDIDTRHSLGEYYTPDWLCERIVSESDIKEKDTVLDPSCGSGSFLLAAIHRKKAMFPNLSIDELCEQIYGIDIHPLSVQISKTTMLLAFGNELKSLKNPIYIHILLSNSLLAPEVSKSFMARDFR
jgi:hypothetical protein